MNNECNHGHPKKFCSLCSVEKIISSLSQDKDEELLKILNSYRNDLIYKEDRNKKFRNLNLFLGDIDLKLYVIKSLRSMADELEKKDRLYVMFAELPEREPPAKGSTMDYIEVMVSYLWGG